MGVLKNSRQERFAQLYALPGPAQGNGTLAATKAEYAENSAHVTASRLLKNAKVKARVAEIQEKFVENREVTAQRLIDESCYVALSDIADAFDAEGRLLRIQEMPERFRRAVSSVKVTELFAGDSSDRTQIGLTTEIKLWSKPDALKLQHQRLGLADQKVHHEGEVRLIAIETGVPLSQWEREQAGDTDGAEDA